MCRGKTTWVYYATAAHVSQSIINVRNSTFAHKLLYVTNIWGMQRRKFMEKLKHDLVRRSYKHTHTRLVRKSVLNGLHLTLVRVHKSPKGM